MSQPDQRAGIYNRLHEDQLARDRESNAFSAEQFFDIALANFNVTSMLDVGCGIGTWMAIAQKRGIKVAGVEGPWCEVGKLEIDKSLVTITDLEQPIDLKRKFDLAISLEVGEHLSAVASPHLVKTLTSHADHVIFSAAIPFQGGSHHINEQYLGFWVDLFAQNGYVVIDLFRGHLWEDTRVHWWLRQNAVLFVRAEAVEANPKLKAESLVVRPVNIIHPEYYQMRVTHEFKQIDQLQNSIRLISEGKARLRETQYGTVVEIIDPNVG